jgi:hypothetical protein
MQEEDFYALKNIEKYALENVNLFYYDIVSNLLGNHYFRMLKI